MSQNLSEDGLKWAENLHNFHNDLRFLPEIMKIEKVKKTFS